MTVVTSQAYILVRSAAVKPTNRSPGKASEAPNHVGAIDIEIAIEIARGSALECAAIQDVLVVGKALDEAESQDRKTELDRMAAMLSRLGGRGYQVREETTGYEENGADSDPDSDSDLDETKPQPCAAPAVALAPAVDR